MPAREFDEAGANAVLMAELQFLIGDQLTMEQVRFEQRAGIVKRRFLLDHALFEPRLRRALAAADRGAAGFERRQQAAGAKDHEM